MRPRVALGVAATRPAGAMACPVLALAVLAACGAPAGGAATGAPSAAPSAARRASGDCLGRLCLGMAEAEALATLDAIDRPDDPGDRRCFHLEDADLDLSFRAAADGGGRRLTAILATSLPHCGGVDGGAGPGGGTPARDAGVIADCRGVRPGDPEAFVVKMHRRAAPIAAPDPLWATAPAGVRGLADRCEPAEAGGPETGIYLHDGQVVGLAIWKP